MYQQLWGYKVEEKLYLGVREQKRLNTTAIGEDTRFPTQQASRYSLIKLLVHRYTALSNHEKIPKCFVRLNYRVRERHFVRLLRVTTRTFGIYSLRQTLFWQLNTGGRDM